MLPLVFNKNGNSHQHADIKSNNINYDICNLGVEVGFKNQSQETDDCYAIVWQGLEQFCYVLQCYTDRGGLLQTLGIELLETNLIEYEAVYGVPVSISTVLKENFNFDCKMMGQPPRGVLRNYFLLSFFNYFDNICWKKNNELIQSTYKKINLSEILDYNSLQQRLDVVFNKNLDFKLEHREFLNKNTPLKQVEQINKILKAVEHKENVEITGLNTISEAYVLFMLECKYFDIPFLLANTFFKNTQEIIEYVDYFPAHMKKPNNLFFKHYKYFTRNSNVDLL